MKTILTITLLLSTLTTAASSSQSSLGEEKSPAFQTAVQSLYKLILADNVEGFHDEWSKYSEIDKKRLAQFNETDSKASLLSYTTYRYSRDPKDITPSKVSGDIAKTLCSYAPEQTNATFVDLNSGTVKTALQKAISRGFTTLALTLIQECDADPNIVAASSSDHSLLLASFIGHLELVKEVAKRLDHISNNIADKSQNTALWYAQNGQKMSTDHEGLYRELHSEHAEVIEFLKASGVTRRSMLGCKILSFSDLIVDDIATNSVFVTKENKDEKMRTYIPQFERTESEIKQQSLELAITQCQQEGFKTCDLVDLDTLHQAGANISENPMMQNTFLLRRVNFGSKQYPVERVIAVAKRSTSLFVYGLEEGISADQCPLL